MSKISIVIPAYNVERYIARCLESCINQTFSDIEILIVDDCGSDDSLKIAQSFAQKDSRIRIIHNAQNLGTFNARLEGIKHALGEYLLFLDADDYLELNACEVAWEKATIPAQKELAQNTKSCQNARADIIHFKAHYLGDKNASFVENCKHKLRYLLPTRFSRAPLQNEQIAYNFFLKSKQFPKFTLWDKCYKASLLKQSALYLESITRPLTMAEDMLKFFVIASLAKSYVSINRRLYFYALNSTSTTQNTRNTHKKIADMCFIAQYLGDLSKGALAKALSATPNFLESIATRMSYNLCALIVLELRNCGKNEIASVLDALDFDTLQTPAQASAQTLAAPQGTEMLLRGGGNAMFRRTLRRIYCALISQCTHATLSQSARLNRYARRFSHYAKWTYQRLQDARKNLSQTREILWQIALCRILHAFAHVLESRPNLCALAWIYPHIWQGETLKSAQRFCTSTLEVRCA
ncbi:glycosyltransferase family 2 protein [Helicobacter sp. MIT 00-7814]|nr:MULTISPECIES: glycosyltransferase family 2 protein [unclassified Helicobacter]RDU52456.1 glycosyltransferase family 2 protein [Helicobacter sp. MIT 00-7814]RDU53181.1 glycosyltransferase family 2 protein [Helicobacter sp. MIT 99-10781]